MAGKKASRALTPPRLATRLIALFATDRDRNALIGDLAEEFARLAQLSAKDARSWYWRQAATSVPHLLLERMRNEEAARLGATMLVAFIAFVLMRVWDAQVARRAASAFLDAANAESYGPARAAYFGVQTIGFALTGAFVAFATFRRDRTFASNAVFRLGPVAIALFAPFAWSIMATSDGYPAATRLLQLALAAPALIGGAYAATNVRSG